MRRKVREQWMRLVSLFLAGVLSCSIFVGCPSRNSKAENRESEISQGEVTQDSVSIVQGENNLTLSGDEIFIEKSLIRTGTSPTRYCFSVYYKPFLKIANNTYFLNMFVYASSEYVNNTAKIDLNKACKYGVKSWVTNTINAAVVKVIADSKDLYVV